MPKIHNRAQNTRRIVQALSFLLFLYLFARTVFPVTSRLPVDLFLRADPLIALSTALALRSVTTKLVLFALPVVVLALLLGRIFCGWLCPLGATLDLSEKIFKWRRVRQDHKKPERFPRLRRLKFYLLVGLLMTALFVAGARSAEEQSLRATLGLPLTYLFDPIALITRSSVLAFFAPLQALLLALHADQALAQLAVSSLVTGHQALHDLVIALQKALALPVDYPGSRPAALFFRLGPVALLIFAVVIALSAFTRRFWCRYLCPLGALLALLSRWAPVKKRVSDECNNCGLCIRTCRMAAISEDPHVYRAAECVTCHECISICPQQAISYSPAVRNLRVEPPLDLSRRRVLQAAGLGVVAVLSVKSDWGAKKNQAGRLKVSAAELIRPPGALPEEQFVAACIRCGECMKVCPTNGLQPALGEGGLEAVGTPLLVPKIGPCTQGCISCSKVCPTGAIQPFTVTEKSWLYLGTAVIDHNLCIAWAADKVCSICDEACSYNAIRQKEPGMAVGVRPVVIEGKCVGCGLCEKSCPLAPQSAIRVYSFGDKRHLSRQEQRDFFEINEAYSK